MRGRLKLVAVATAAITLALAACTDGDDEGGEDGGSVKVVAAFYPVYEATERVGGDLVDVTNITPAGGEPHDLELNSRQVDRIEDADVVLYFGHGFQPALEKAAVRATGTKVDLLSEVANLLQAPEGEEDLDVDPHVWLDPMLFKAIVSQVATALSEADPANRTTYETNAAAYGRELDNLDTAFRGGLAACDRRVLVTSHSAFGYLARRYGLTQESIAGLEPESEPTPERLAELASQVHDDGTTTIFYETLVSPKVAEALAREAGLKTAVLDPLEGLSDEDAERAKTYISVMKDNLAAIRSALGCR